MSLKMNFVLQKSDMMLKKDSNIHGIKMATISCRVKDLPIGNKKNLYQVLSLESQNVSFHDLKKAYRAKALQLHPDVSPSSIKEECTKQFVELREAYEVLSDPNSRRIYDLSLVESMGCGLGDHAYSEQRMQYSRMVWEMQLKGLMYRSERRNVRFV
ncbi:hypothetical protein L2E82_08169 [Cichorium intybus]|uniref:Uncharacterized protein n=1 Tax=Cichorium intybus TaxID=13427 RepID=A0ACB9G5V4_CICIN|nr:hypothetical protein L2E82_08169 [Cichorium intybus]